MEDKRLKELAEKFINGEASASEEAELHAWWNEEKNNDEEQVVVTERPVTYASVRDRILGKLNEQIDAEAEPVRRVRTVGKLVAGRGFVAGSCSYSYRPHTPCT